MQNAVLRDSVPKTQLEVRSVSTKILLCQVLTKFYGLVHDFARFCFARVCDLHLDCKFQFHPRLDSVLACPRLDDTAIPTNSADGLMLFGTVEACRVSEGEG